jgi:hypothetical protein
VQELGYEPSAKLRAPVERAWLKTGYERGFDGPQGKNLLELQWRAAPGFYAVDIDVLDWFQRATCSSLGERKVRALSPEDLLLALCVHASKHAWMRLGWICDIGGVTQSQRIDYDVVRERAAALGILRIIEVSLEMAHRLLGRAVPLQLEPKAVGGVQDLCDRVTRIVARGTDYETESLEYFRLMLALRERASDRWPIWMAFVVYAERGRMGGSYSSWRTVSVVPGGAAVASGKASRFLIFSSVCFSYVFGSFSWMEFSMTTRAHLRCFSNYDSSKHTSNQNGSGSP